MKDINLIRKTIENLTDSLIKAENEIKMLKNESLESTRARDKSERYVITLCDRLDLLESKFERLQRELESYRDINNLIEREMKNR